MTSTPLKMINHDYNSSIFFLVNPLGKRGIFKKVMFLGKSWKRARKQRKLRELIVHVGSGGCVANYSLGKRKASFARTAIVCYLAQMLNINNYWLLVMIKSKFYNTGKKFSITDGSENRICFISNTLPDVFLMTSPNASCLSAID